MSKINKVKHTREVLLALIGGATLLMSGCTGSEDDLSSIQQSSLSSPEAIASESADNYDDNSYGLVTAQTLKSWIDNWGANKPAGISGKLVILQTQSGPAGFEYIKPDGVNVFTYEATEWVETRDNGVVQTKSMVPSGASMDTFLSKYDIDPRNDMIVCGMGTGGYGQAMRAGRCWYMFRYWGTAKENLAVLNGGNGWIGANTTLDADYFTDTQSSTSWATGGVSVKDLPENNFSLQATLEDMVNVVPDTDTNILDDGVFIWDARGDNQYNPTGDSDFQSGPVQGHPNGALNLNFTNLLDATDDAYTYKPKAELAAYMTGAVDAGGNGFLDSTVQAVGEGSAYQNGDVIYTYCETTYRAMITGFASASILGLPTRFYDGAMTEWHSLSYANAGGDPWIPLTSPWRTDKSSRSIFIQKTVPVDVPEADDSGYITGAYATSANKIIEEDKAYKGLISSVSSDSSGGGASLPANPCGG